MTKSGGGRASQGGPRWGVALPALLLLVAVMVPLISGARTLFLRDVFALHLPLKAAQARLMTAGEEGLVPPLPLVAPTVAGGQPLLGNLNAAPLYPDNLLYLFTPLLWAFNAHFWIHFLLAPLALYWLAREWGLTAAGAAAAAVAFGASGYLLSQLNLYNLVAGVALAPALAAAMLRLTTPDGEPVAGAASHRGRWFAVVAGLWALEVLAGDPMIAGQGVLLGLTAVVVARWQGVGKALLRPGLTLLAALAVGTLLAAPQWIETLRILPLSYRGHQGYSATTAGVASFHPQQVLEWFLPLAFGRPDVLAEGAFWGAAYYDGFPPLYFTLYPGWVVLALIAASGLSGGRARRWAWLVVGTGVFLALGASNPLVKPLLGWAGSLFRYPIKFWLLVAVGGSVLAGLGLERLLALGGDQGGAAARLRRWIGWGLGGVAALYLVLAGALVLAAEGAARVLTTAGVPPPLAAAEVRRWLGLALLTLVVLALTWVLLRLVPRKPGWAAALLLLLHTASQLFLLRPVMPTDATAFYRQPPPALAVVPPESRVFFGAGPGGIRPYAPGGQPYPEPDAFWGVRHLVTELSPTAGALFDRRYALNVSAEGLSSFLTQASVQSLRLLDDPRRLRLLAAWGVDRLVLPSPLGEDVGEQVRRLAPTELTELTEGTEETEGPWVYEILGAAPEVSFAHRLIFAPHLNAALGTLAAPGFEVATTAVLPGEIAPFEGRPGRLGRITVGRETLEVDVDSPDGGAVVWQRSHLGLYRAAIDGHAAPVEIANLHRIGIKVPPGAHVVRVWVDRRSLSWGFVLSLLGVAGLVVARRWFRLRESFSAAHRAP